MTFTERIVLTSLQSGGFLNGYAVNNFTIEYALDDQDFAAYGVIERPQVSTTATSAAPHLINPVTTQSLATC